MQDCLEDAEIIHKNEGALVETRERLYSKSGFICEAACPRISAFYKKSADSSFKPAFEYLNLFDNPLKSWGIIKIINKENILDYASKTKIDFKQNAQGGSQLEVLAMPTVQENLRITINLIINGEIDLAEKFVEASWGGDEKTKDYFKTVVMEYIESYSLWKDLKAKGYKEPWIN
ncbi:MAG: hypothetical protein H6850_01725 [Alphaproteobacteria bacterium]|nr:MAG: hypothetical protein H6850_01725 [Alphaproteobacteria bacterium]